ncbi:hypothetical protein E5P55_00810 [Candidatus Pinguicoccus supinus]|uniref:Uncharacterized protein n=1 Tax=Candidatus Pinguicoccus supinus TaxID=2529394 RepID=A0A7T0BRN1_9BACT|nr:hypothetical protein E5P55_00810 [Candidatus Pinguicoccus supinus]
MSERINFKSTEELLEVPDLLDNQLSSYKYLFQKYESFENFNLLFKDIFPISSSDLKYRLEYVKY